MLSGSGSSNLTVAARFLAGVFLLANGYGQSTAGILNLKTPVSDHVSAQQTRSYALEVKTGSYIQVSVKQQGVDIVLTLLSPDRKVLWEENRVAGLVGTETVFWIAQEKGTYWIEIRQAVYQANPGKYEVQVDVLRDASRDDVKRVDAEHLYSQAERRLRGRTVADFTAADELYRQAIPLFRQVGATGKVIQSLLNLGYAHTGLKDQEQAARYHEEALAVERKRQDRAGEARVLSYIAETLTSFDEHQKAISYLDQALRIYRQLDDKQQQIATLRALGSIYMHLNQESQALGLYDQAVQVQQASGIPVSDYFLLVSISRELSSMKHYTQAIAYLEKALLLRSKLSVKQVNSVLYDLGFNHYRLSQYSEAAGFFEERLRNSNGVPDDLALLNLANCFEKMNAPEKAETYYQQAMEADRKDERRLVIVTRPLAAFYWGRANYARAFALYEQTADIFHRLNDVRSESTALAILAEHHFALAHFEETERYIEKALALSRSIHDRRGEQAHLIVLGDVFESVNQSNKAMECFNQVLAIANEIKSPFVEANALESMAWVTRDRGRYEESARYDERALALDQEFKYHLGEARVQDSLGQAYYHLGRYDQAAASFQGSLKNFRELGLSWGEAWALRDLGLVAFRKQDYPHATYYLHQALLLASQSGNRLEEGQDLGHLMNVSAAAGYPHVAAFYGKQAVNALQEVRADNSNLREESQLSFLIANQNLYRDLADLLLSQGRIVEAEQVIRLLKHDEYLHFLRRDEAASGASRRADMTSEESEWARKYRELSPRLVSIGMQKRKLEDRIQADPLLLEQAEVKDELEALSKQLAVGNRGFREFLDQLNKLDAKVMTSAHPVDLRDTEALKSDLADLGTGVVAVYTLVGEEKLRTILVTSKVERAYEYPISATDLNRKVAALRQALQSPRRDPRELAGEMYEILISRELAEDLRSAEATTVMWSLDGSLRYLPIAALYDRQKGQYLLERYRNVVFTPASNARLKDKPRSDLSVAGFGVTKEHEGFMALPQVGAELAGIVRGGAGSRGILPGVAVLDEQFTESALDANVIGHPIVHIASHFRFQPGDETNSYLLLGDGGHLTVAALKNKDQIFAGVDLLTLSACNTGVGDIGGNGQELESFSVLAQRKGAKAVLGTLWSVADDSTSILMQEFYRIRSRDTDIPKAEALRQAQLGLLHRGAGGESAPGRGVAVSDPAVKASVAGYSHPFYWAPFYLVGNWQ